MDTSTASADAMRPFRPPHKREPWDTRWCSTTFVHAKLSILKGSEEGMAERKQVVAKLYEKAKLEADFEAANRLVDLMWRDSVEDRIGDLVLAAGVRPIIAFPHPGFDDEDCVDHDAGSRLTSRNALPFAIKERVRLATDGFENITIKQAARVGRTKLARFPRFVFQPSFVGDVDPRRPYFLVDDTFTLGGTLAVMRSHIVRHGGTVIGACALAHSLGRDIPFAMTAEIRDLLFSVYGSELDALWKGEIGHEPARLSDAEGRFLLDWSRDARGGGASLLQQLRARIDRARTHCR